MKKEDFLKRAWSALQAVRPQAWGQICMNFLSRNLRRLHQRDLLGFVKRTEDIFVTIGAWRFFTPSWPALCVMAVAYISLCRLSGGVEFHLAAAWHESCWCNTLPDAVQFKMLLPWNGMELRRHERARMAKFC
eukprot:2837693-Amphidinium_carterae.1